MADVEKRRGDTTPTFPKLRGDRTPTFEFRLIRIDNDLTTEELPLDAKLAQAIDTCLRMGLPVAPRGLRPRLQGAREFLKGVPIEEIGVQESEKERWENEG